MAKLIGKYGRHTLLSDVLLSRNDFTCLYDFKVFSRKFCQGISFVIVVLGFVYFLCFEIDVNMFFLQKKIYYFKKAPLFNFPKTEISLITLNWKFALFSVSVKQNKRKIQNKMKNLNPESVLSCPLKR